MMTKMAKVKISPEGKIYDTDGFWLRAAAVCVKDDSESEVLLVTSSGHSERWIIPGGKVQLNECPEKSAMREAMEEGGVVGVLGRYLGVFDNLERRHRTRVYVLRVSQLVDDFDDKDRRQRQWFTVEEAQRMLVPHKPTHLRYLAAMRATRDAANPDTVQDSFRDVTPSGLSSDLPASLGANGVATNGVTPATLNCDAHVMPEGRNSCSCFFVS